MPENTVHNFVPYFCLKFNGTVPIPCYDILAVPPNQCNCIFMFSHLTKCSSPCLFHFLWLYKETLFDSSVTNRPSSFNFTV